MYDLVIFDLDGTLYKYEDIKGVPFSVIYGTRFHNEILKRAGEFISKRLGVTPAQALKVRNTLLKKYDGSISVGLQTEYGIRRREYLNYAWDIDVVKYLKPNPKLRAFLSQIRIRKALLTAAPAIWAKRALRRLGVDDLFDGMWCGDDDIRKPLKEAYLNVTSSMKEKPEKTIIVEDEVRYLKPAKEVGMTTVLIGSKKEDFIDYNISSIYEIKRLLGRKPKTQG